MEKFKIFLIENWAFVNEVELHDWIIYAYFRALSMKWYIDKIPLVHYRQHKDNQIGANIYWKAYLIRLKKINNGWYRNEVQKIINLLKPYTKDDLHLNRIYLIKNFFNLRRRFRDAIILLLLNVLRLF